MNKKFYERPEAELLHVLVEGNFCWTLLQDPESVVDDPWKTDDKDDEGEPW